MEWELIITGCGTSHGSPPWGIPARWSTDRRDFRRRSGAILKGPAGQVVLVDVGPDLRAQLTDPYKDWDGRSYPERCITRADAVLLTHDHADHCHGINELRHLNRLMGGAGITLHGLAEHLEAVQRMFAYCFGSGGAYDTANPVLSVAPMTPHEPAVIAGLPVTCLPLSHGPAGTTAGFRFGDVGYLTDLKTCPPASLAALHGLELLVLDMLRAEPHPTHLCLAEAMAIIETLRPAHTVLTHMGTTVRYAQWAPRLPAGVELAVDGLCRRFSA